MLELIRVDKDDRGVVKEIVLRVNGNEYSLSEKLGQLLIHSNSGKVSVLPFLPCVSNEVLIDTE